MKKQRRRHVFGRVRTWDPESGKPATVELTRDGVKVRVLHARAVHALKLEDVVTLAIGQGVLPLRKTTN